MITGAHSILYSVNAEADRAFFRDVLRLPNVDVGEGWLIFALPPAELAVHPSDENDEHELYLIADDVEAFCTAMGKNGVSCTPVANMGWGMLTSLTLPGGGKIGVYEPRHPRPPAAAAGGPGKAVKRVKGAAKKALKPAKSLVRAAKKATAKRPPAKKAAKKRGRARR